MHHVTQPLAYRLQNALVMFCAQTKANNANINDARWLEVQTLSLMVLIIRTFTSKCGNCTTLKCAPVNLNTTLVSLNSTPVGLRNASVS